MGFESIPKPGNFGSERIKIVGKDGVERSLTPEEYEEHVKAEARREDMEKKAKESEGLRQLIEKFKGTLRPETPEEDDSETEGGKRAAA